MPLCFDNPEANEAFDRELRKILEIDELIKKRGQNFDRAITEAKEIEKRLNAPKKRKCWFCNGTGEINDDTR